MPISVRASDLSCARRVKTKSRRGPWAIDIYRQRLIAFTISAFFVGIGGVLYGHFLGVISIDVFFLDTTFLTLAMLVVGGMRSLAGAVVGVLVLSAVIEVLRRLETGIDIGGFVVSVPSGSSGDRACGRHVAHLLVSAARHHGRPRAAMGFQ